MTTVANKKSVSTPTKVEDTLNKIDLTSNKATLLLNSNITVTDLKTNKLIVTTWRKYTEYLTKTPLENLRHISDQSTGAVKQLVDYEIELRSKEKTTTL